MQKAVLLRLESYLMLLQELKAIGHITVTSEELAVVGGVSDSRVRQDLIQLHVVGKPHSGYTITELEILIYSSLDLLRPKGMALVGCGNLGRALAQSEIWEHAGFQLKAVFDTEQEVIGTTVADRLIVRHIRELPGVIKSEGIISACLTVPVTAAQSVCNLLVSSGILGIWNFAPIKLQIPDHVVVENPRLEQGLMTLSYLMRQSHLTPNAASDSASEDNRK